MSNSSNNSNDKSSTKTPMTPEAASRIQSNADKNAAGPGFKERAQSAAAKNTVNSDSGKKAGK